MNNQNWMKFTKGYTNKNLENGGKRKNKDSEYKYASGVVGPINIVCNGKVIYKNKVKED